LARVLGIDPGSIRTGFGVVEDTPTGLRLVACGCIRLGAAPFPERLKQIYDGIHAVARQHTPEQLAIEQVFMHKNADSALKLGQARGAAICGGLAAGLPVHEYSARQVKQALVGKGSADKTQVQHMVKVLLRTQDNLEMDASDALGIAICHIHHLQTRLRAPANVRRPGTTYS
jgi:crossover junction endodeoxyribonuclease RuvC